MGGRSAIRLGALTIPHGRLDARAPCRYPAIMAAQIIGLSDIGRAVVGAFKIYVGVKAVGAGLQGLSEAASGRTAKQLAAFSSAGNGPAKLTLHPTRGSIHDRIRLIREAVRKGYVDPRVRKLAVQALSRKCGRRADGRTNWCTPEKDAEAEVVALFNFTRDNVRYVRDIFGIDTYPTPQRTLEFGGEDCDGSVILLAALLLSVGYPVMGRIIRTTKAEDWDHIFVVVGLPPGAPTKWVGLDPSVDRPAGWTAPREMIAAKLDFEFLPA